MIDDDTLFYDLCCGSGAISIELVNRGFNPSNIIMVDKSPWGLFWKQIGDCTFSIDLFRYWIDEVPKDITKIQGFIKELSKVPVYSTQLDISYIFLLLQASAFGSKSIWIENDKWQNCSFRNYWLPTETSNRKSPVNPMMPMPETLYQRVEDLAFGMEGVKGYYCDVNDMEIRKENSVVYIDPPYKGTTQYGFKFDYIEYINKINKTTYISEGYKFTDIAYKIDSERKKGGISGDRKNTNEEWLNRYTGLYYGNATKPLILLGS